VLDEVRPYLISDGGNIEVVSVDPEKQEVKRREVEEEEEGGISMTKVQYK